MEQEPGERRCWSSRSDHGFSMENGEASALSFYYYLDLLSGGEPAQGRQDVFPPFTSSLVVSPHTHFSKGCFVFYGTGWAFSFSTRTGSVSEEEKRNCLSGPRRDLGSISF